MRYIAYAQDDSGCEGPEMTNEPTPPRPSLCCALCRGSQSGRQRLGGRQGRHKLVSRLPTCQALTAAAAAPKLALSCLGRTATGRVMPRHAKPRQIKESWRIVRGPRCLLHLCPFTLCGEFFAPSQQESERPQSMAGFLLSTNLLVL